MVLVGDDDQVISTLEIRPDSSTERLVRPVSAAPVLMFGRSSDCTVNTKTLNRSGFSSAAPTSPRSTESRVIIIGRLCKPRKYFGCPGVRLSIVLRWIVDPGVTITTFRIPDS